MIIELMIEICILSLVFLLVKYKIVNVVYIIIIPLLRKFDQSIKEDNKIGGKEKALMGIVIGIVILIIQVMLIYEFAEFLQTIPTIYKDIVNYTLGIINNGI